MNNKKFSIWEHIEELRKRIIYCLLFFILIFTACYYFKEQIISILFLPLLNASPNVSLVYTNIPDLFLFFIITNLRLSFLLSIPFTVLQIWKFVEPALKKKEKKSILPTLIWSPILFALGTSLCYFLIMPIIMEFFTAYNSSINLPNADISLLQNVKEYFSFFMTLLIAFGLAFQLPIVLIFLIRLGILSVNNLKKFRRYFIVLAFITGAILTPPDVLSQILLSIPLIILYESTILIAKQK